MNIVYFHTHDTGRYIQPYGYAVPAPHLQRLAEEGYVFRQAFCAGPTCSPSRTGLLSGMAPHSAGMLGLAHRGFRMNDYSRHLASFLSRSGYETVLSGVQHEVSADQIELLGYTRNLNALNTEKSREARDLKSAGLAADFIRGPHDKPFFASVGLFNTHRTEADFPETSHPVDPRYVMPPHPMYDSPQNRDDMAGFIASAAVVDRCAGIVLQALEESGLKDDTIFIYTTDHGIAFPRMKCNLYDTGIGVSLIMRVPGRERGLVVDSLVSQLDLFPTLCELLGLKKPVWLQGRSLVPLLDGTSAEIRSEVFAEVTYHAAYEPMRCIRTKQYKLIRFYDDHDEFVMPNIDDGYSKRFLVEHGFRERRRAKEMLFDLYLDPVERENVIDDPAYGEIAKDLSGRLQNWMERTGDPLLAGNPVPLPEGAWANSREELNPS
ncbi:sulfatase [Paenibacillus contaminans]|uniref:Sulfatase n=1 Tax=Paenibacillus contaminans TaxID=450362 RepID=A0A329MRB5_9BACL|nr:sulfatase [Paenibacillus contaminans]RAV22324.1 sulfatase [Paenibacillus contaminans]